jgi:iron complex outermembrane recepter protein
MKICSQMRFAACCLTLVVCWMAIRSAAAQDADSLAATSGSESSTTGSNGVGGGLDLNMNLDQLSRQDVVVPGLSTPVSTVDRQESTVGRSPAAVYVVTPEMIKRSGARNIPDVLRMVPGLDVARINSSTWAISSRGFNDRISNFLLVQIDGRVVYNATFGGVYWNQQDVVLEDVERIEVIRGPGTTMWGSNAVNGVINIITKKASDTQGALVQSGGGSNLQRDFNTVRYGGQIGENLSWRVFGQQFDNARGWSETAIPDDWHVKHGGFRMDYTPSPCDTFTLQGDLMTGKGAEQLHSIPMRTFPFSGTIDSDTFFPAGNVLMRYIHEIDDDTNWQLMGYYDNYTQNYALVNEQRSTYNIDLQCQFRPFCNHRIITGGFYRNSSDNLQGNDDGFVINFDPQRFTTQWLSGFVQDEIMLEEDRWYLTPGVRLEQNTFGHFQVEPTVRLMFLPSERQTMWAAVSRAVRNPTRLDTQGTFNFGIDPNLPVFASLRGNPNFVPEKCISYEVGYRAAPTDYFTWDLATYFSDYTDVFSTGPFGDPVVVPPGYVYIPAEFGNANSARTYGGEITSTLQMTPAWKFISSYTLYEINPQGDLSAFMSSPHNQIYLRSAMDFGSDVQFDVIGRYVDALAISVPAYFEMDVRIGWRWTDSIEVSFVGQNLINPHHLEFGDPAYLVASQVPRGFYGMLTWTR